MSNVGGNNSGHSNVGNRNVGHSNVGHYNLGCDNVGNSNVGHWNVGNRNVGNRNVGSWNVCDRSTGYFNTITPDTILFFNKPFPVSEFEILSLPDWIFFELTEWIDENEMSEDEKKNNPTYKVNKGYLKSYTYKDAWANAYNNASEEEIRDTINLPNFDYDVFEEISGIDLRNHNKIIEIDGKKYKLTEIRG